MTKADAIKEFRLVYRDSIPRGDVVWRRTEWLNYTDRLHKDGLITLWQYEQWTNPF